MTRQPQDPNRSEFDRQLADRLTGPSEVEVPELRSQIIDRASGQQSGEVGGAAVEVESVDGRVGVPDAGRGRLLVAAAVLVLAAGTGVLLALAPPPPAGLAANGAKVVGRFTDSFVNPTSGRGRPLLLQMSAECETSIAMMAPAPQGGSDGPGDVRHMAGTSYWDEPWPDGQSLALGWSPDGSEAYVWRYNGLCSTSLAKTGVYGYTVDGAARLIASTDDDVTDVFLFTDAD